MEDITIDFLESIYILDKLPVFYKELHCDFTSNLSYINLESKSIPIVENNIITIKDIPSYTDIKTNNLPKHIKQVEIPYYKGFAINFDNIETTEEYLKSRFGNSSRYKLRRSIKKLESAFDISYKMFYGEISQVDYDIILKAFFKLLEMRSLEKGIINNRNIKRKDFYYEKIKPLILKKRASLFVIYNGNIPIDICLNLHNDNVIFQLIRTYDINYSKYNTGYIDLIKQIDWCISNNIRFITFGYGSYYWKKRWCNYNYPYKFDIFYNKLSLRSRFRYLVQLTNLKLRHYLRERGYIDRFHEIKNSFKEKLKPTKELNITIENLDFDEKIDIDATIDINNANHSFLKRYVFDFLFNSNEKEKDIYLYSIKNSSNKYLIKGLKSKAVLCVK